MRVMIIGGTGLLGYHAAHELLERGHQVNILALPPLPAEDLFPPEVYINLSDFNQLSDGEVEQILLGHDAVVFAAGVDDRVTPKAPAYPFFHHHNVKTTQRLVQISRRANISRFIILGSYFAYFHRVWPHLELTRHHPYIRSRVEQHDAAVEAAGDELVVVTLELPYIFGVMPGRLPLWKPLVEYAASPLPLFYPRGGTTCVTVTDVAREIATAVESGEAGGRYPVVGENLRWTELMSRLAHLSGRRKAVITLPDWIVKAGAVLLKAWHMLRGLESGLDPVHFIKLQTSHTFINTEETRVTLQDQADSLENSLRETVERSLKKQDPARRS